jgi:hypothetical protein
MIPSLERDQAHPPGAPLCFRPLSSKKEVSLPHLVPCIGWRVKMHNNFKEMEG